ncbi:hypothetical protein [Bradyrhizobium sp. Leo170]|uniref:hypothetical protein n=1 Tax=Bradyrhizobium sp. Leo170 TaxID=1571199 RepID=UPI00102EA000|nr:hypothetical protein [Bradyrhizobium sp. Leo170]TAI67613.1 hypothetical protein CWO89_02005 [Bradyrhizobium sp. Leo170]
MACTFVRDVLHERSAPQFASRERLMETVPMMNTPYFPRKNEIATPVTIDIKDDDWARAPWPEHGC